MRRDDSMAGVARWVVKLGVAVALVSGVPGWAAAQSGKAPAPSVDGENEDEAERETPAGHPAVAASPHAANGGAVPGVFQPPEDIEREDPSLPAGTISVDLLDADNLPVPGEIVTLGILANSVAKGENRRHVQQTTDAHGHTVFGGLEMASTIAYRVSVGYQGGAFAALPFQLPQGKAMHVALHVYPVTRDIQKAVVVVEATIAAEIRDDRIQIEEGMTVYNLGRNAWQPDDVRMALPPGFTAFSAQASMSDQGADAVADGVTLRGTFAPGQHSVDFRWQLPWSEEKDVDFDVGLPPHVAIARVVMPASGSVKLTAAGFPDADVRHDSKGQSFLVTERRVRPDEGRLSSISIGLHDLPTPGPGRKVAAGLAALGVAIGVILASRKRGMAAKIDPNGARASILADLLDLEKARASGQVGARTYERARREIIDALALTFART